MVSLCTSNQDIDKIKHLIRTKSNHTYLEKFIPEPIIDIDKILILYHIYNHISIPESQKRQYITTIMLIQIALDTHELVPTQPETQKDETEKQLSVLAGDYYSGLYYLLLSELEEIEMIQILATSIKQINEYKMKLYYREVTSLEDLKFTIKKIESLLFSNVASYLNEPIIVPIIEEWLLINKMIIEKELILQESESPLFDFIMHRSTESRYTSAVKIIEHEIVQSVRILEDLLNDTPLHLRGLKAHIKEVLAKKLYKSTSMAEEG